MYPVLKSELREGEKLIWAAQPALSTRLSPHEFFLIPLSLVWLGLACFGEYNALMAVLKPKEGSLEGLVMPLVYFPFLIAGLYLLAGRFVYKEFMKKQTYYALTNERVLRLRTSETPRIEALALDELSVCKERRAGDGRVSILFASSLPFWQEWVDELGLEWMAAWFAKPVLVFRDLSEADKLRNALKEKLVLE